MPASASSARAASATTCRGSRSSSCTRSASTASATCSSSAPATSAWPSDYQGFNNAGFEIVALVDSDPQEVGRASRSGIPVLAYDGLERIVRENAVEIGVIAVTAESAQDVHDALVNAGVYAVLNFAPVQLRTHERVKVKTVDLRINLESLSFFLKNVEDGTF